MPPVQIARLRPQVNALMAHYQDREYFRKTLLLIFERYSEKKSITNTWLRTDPGLPAYQVPLIVINELESAFSILAKTHPAESARLADMLWALPHYEPKKLAIFLLARLAPPYQDEFIRHVEGWITEGLPESLIAEVIEQSSQKPELVGSPQWTNLVRAWILSGRKDLKKVGIRAAVILAENRDFQNLPLLFDLVAPLYTQPRIAIQKSVMELTRRLIERSQPETASFLISLAEMNRRDEVFALIRKCLPLFDSFYQGEIRKTVIT